MFVALLVWMLVAVEAVEANQVSCGRHIATSCSECTQGNGATWCNGQCAWCYTTKKCYPKGTDCTVVARIEPLEKRIERVEKALGLLTKSFETFMAMIKKLQDEVKKQGELLEKNKRVDGSWGAWSAFVACTKSCGVEQQTRTRHCDSPPPSNGGSNCQGAGIETKSCNHKACGPSVKYIDLKNKFPQNHKPSFYCPSGYKYSRHVCGTGAFAWNGSGSVQWGPLTNDEIMTSNLIADSSCQYRCDCNSVRIECKRI